MWVMDVEAAVSGTIVSSERTMSFATKVYQGQASQSFVNIEKEFRFETTNATFADFRYLLPQHGFVNVGF